MSDSASTRLRHLQRNQSERDEISAISVGLPIHCKSQTGNTTGERMD